ncbi:hypothetical protein PG999_006124 [Apiospora kogelbergensis]|uniref:C3H1-type domain-containing protein n=1 Tax=Apiospora kogelbergensis TaxID=1337665 RepID=A0AAW0QPV2_9PEZI
MLRPHAPPFPQHFLVRPATTKHTASGTITMPGPMVPLIALDQLPAWIDISGVPRELTVEQTMGLQNLGSVIPGTAEYYEVRLHQDVRFVTSSSSSSFSPPPPPSCTPQRRSGSGETGDRINSGKNTKMTSSLLMDPIFHPSDTDLPGSSSNSSVTNNSCETSSTERAINNSTRRKKTTMKKGEEKAATVSKTETANKWAKGNTAAAAATRPAAVPLNPRRPSPPPPAIPVNPYPILRRHHHDVVAPPPGPNHPASRLLSAITPAPSYIYSPAHPQQQPPTSSSNHKPSSSQLHSSRHNRAIVYCRHWCHHGSCKYGEECRYKHRMPGTNEGLREVGLADWPNWYRAACTMALNMQSSRRSGWHESWPDITAAPVDAGSGSRCKGVSSQHKARRSSSHNVVLVNDGSSSVSTAAATVSRAKGGDESIAAEERFGRLGNAESGGSDESSGSSSAGYQDPETAVHQTAAGKRQDRAAEDMPAPGEKLVDV